MAQNRRSHSVTPTTASPGGPRRQQAHADIVPNTNCPGLYPSTVSGVSTEANALAYQRCSCRETYLRDLYNAISAKSIFVLLDVVQRQCRGGFHEDAWLCRIATADEKRSLAPRYKQIRPYSYCVYTVPTWYVLSHGSRRAHQYVSPNRERTVCNVSRRLDNTV